MLSPDDVELIVKENGYQETHEPQPGDLVVTGRGDPSAPAGSPPLGNDAGPLEGMMHGEIDMLAVLVLDLPGFPSRRL